VASTGKPRHVVAQFGEDLLGTAPGNAGDSVETLQRGGVGTRLFLDPVIEELDLLLEKLDVTQKGPEQEGVVLGDAPDHCVPQLRRIGLSKGGRELR
jgi:hypothetical protein